MRTEGIVLRVLRYGDNARIVHIYTAADGMLTFMVRGSAGRKTGIRQAFLQPMTLVTVDYDLRQSKNMQSLRDIRMSVPYSSLMFDMGKRAIALFLSEVLHAVLRGEQGNASLLSFISSSLQWLDLADGGYANFHLIFLLQLTRYIGFYPEHLPEADRLNLPLLLRFNYRSMHLLRLSADDRQDFIARLLAFYAENVPSFPEIKSAEILHTLFI